jgi:sugar phosphate permease
MPDLSGANYRWVIVGVLWLVHVISFFNFSSLGILAPFLKEDLNLSSTQIGLFISAVSIGACLSQIPVGLITDLVSVRFLLPLSIGLMALFLSLFSFSGSYASAIMILLIYGLTTGAIGPAASKSVMDWFPTVGRATAMGLKQTGVNFGGILAGVLLPVLALNFSWRKGLLMVGLAEVVCAALIYKLAKNPPARMKEPSPPFDWKIVRSVILNRNILILGGIDFFFFACQFCFSAYLTLFLTQELKISVGQAGHFFALAFFVGAIARILWSFVSDYYLGGRRKGILLLITWMELLSLCILSLISFFPYVSKFLLLAVLIFGMSGIGWNAIFLILLGEAAGKGSTGLATATGFFFGFMGSLICPPLFGYVVDTMGAYGYGWLFLTLCAAAILLLLGLFPEKNSEKKL